MELRTCPFCQSDVLTIYGNEKMKCNVCGMTFLKSAESTDSILDIWQNRESTAEHDKIHVSAGNGMIKPTCLTVPKPITQLDSASSSQSDIPLHSEDQVDNELEDVDFGNVDEIDLF